ncbi:MAG: hypothetical protein CVU05_10515 [Bacteroidetes bacterium HGW-Bacteroidetes-21]|jgi:hypothetical protein|nr:MAG: hypothetical protein CVU05_10515 [Bacteroidetes bacterium HGW-Bacteroidetes-21]
MCKTILLFILTALTISAYAIEPVKTYSSKPSDYGMNYEEVKIPVSDGAILNAWMFKATKTSYKIMVLSDDGKGNMADLMEQVSLFLSLGYHVITYDYRGFGASSDFELKNEFYMYAQFEKDLNAVVDYLKKNHTNIPKIHLYGIGMGAGLSIAVATNRELGYVIADSPYQTLDQIQAKIKEVKGVDVKIPLGYDKTLIEPKYALPKKGNFLGGLMLIVGDKDLLYTVKDIKEIQKLGPKNSQLYVVKNSVGDNNYTANKDEYLKVLEEFLKNVK